MSAPLPCPFCGCKDIAVVEGSTFRWRLAQCNGCGAQGPDVRIQTSGSGTKEEWEQSALDGALTEWNRRHAEADLAAARAMLGEVREWIPYYRWIPDLRERVDAIIGKKTP